MRDTRSSLGWTVSRNGAAFVAGSEASPSTDTQFLQKFLRQTQHTRLIPGSVHLWVFDVTLLDSSMAGYCRSVLSQEEIERAGRFRSAEDQNRFECGRGIIRRILSHYTGQPPSHIRFRLGRHGKPFLKDSGLLVNWSHSASLWSLAIAETGALGVDIEIEANAKDWAGPASIAFSTSEIAYVIQAQDQECRKRHFLQVWTRKEALFKASGKGLHDSMTATSVIDANGSPATRLDLGAEGRWWLTQFHTAASAMGALVTEFEPIDFRIFDGQALVVSARQQSRRSVSRKSCLPSVRLEPLS